GMQQNVRAFAMNRATEKQKFERLAAPQWERPEPWPEELRIHSIGDHVNSRWLDATFYIDATNVLRMGPHFIQTLVYSFRLLRRQAAVFPRLYNYPVSFPRGGPVRRPLVAHMDIRRLVEMFSVMGGERRVLGTQRRAKAVLPDWENG